MPLPFHLPHVPDCLHARSATPADLYESGVKFMAKHQPKAQVYFTGDFAEAGASSPCHGSAQATAQQQILDVIHYDWTTLKAAMPSGTKVFGSLGNHDSAPGDVYYGGNDGGNGKQSWEYNNLTALWADDVGEDPLIAKTIRRGGYYASRAATPGLTVISLNINYWVVQNPEAGKAGSSAAMEGTRMMGWLADELSAAEARVSTRNDSFSFIFPVLMVTTISSEFADTLGRAALTGRRSPHFRPSATY